MIEITYQSVVDGLSAIVAERGENFVYPRHTSWCVYVYAGRPDCGVGCFLDSVGVPLERLVEADLNDRGSGISASALLEQLKEEGIVSVDLEAARILNVFQERQDNGHTWGSALNIALGLPEVQA